jgi:enterochelin esterase-like enzyme
MGLGIGLSISIGGSVPAGPADADPPELVSAVVPAAGTTCVLTYDEALTAGAVTAAAFTLSGTFATVASASASGTEVTLTFTVPLYVTEGDTVLLSYTPGVAPIQDSAGNDAANLTNQAVTNNSTLPDQLTDAPGTHAYSFTGENSAQTCAGRYWFPSSYDPAEASTYPVILAMHGKGGTSNTTNTAFIPELEAAIAAGQIRDCIVIMPDSNGADWGTDATGVGTGTVLAETKLVDDVIPYFQARTRSNGTLVATGFSMGGWSVTVLGMRNDGLFDAVWPLGCPNMDTNPTSGNANNWRWVNSVFSDLGANDTDDVQAQWGPTSTGGEQTTTLAALTADSPLATATGGALANTNTAAIISGLPLFYCKSAGDATSLTSLNAMTAGYTALSIPHGFVDLVTPTHNAALYYAAAQDAATIAAGNGFKWLEAKFAGSDVIAPKLSGAPTINTAGTELTITFDKTLTSNSPTAAQFTLGGVPTGVTVSSAAASGTSVVLTLNAIIAAGASGITVSMASADAAVKVLSAAGVPTAPRTAVAVTNNSTATLAGLVTSVAWHYLFEVYTTASVTESGGAVSAVTDQSGAGHSLSQGTAGCRPTYSATSGPNSTPGITHDGADGASTGDFLPTSAFDIAAPATTAFYELLVFKQVAWTNADRITARPGGNIQIRQAGTTPAITMNNTTGVNSNTAATIGSWFRLEAGFTGSTSDFLKIGSTNVTGASAGNTDPASGSSTIGAVAGGTTASNIAWTIWGATAGIPTNDERTNIGKWILGKYGSTVTQ